jgi:phosphoglycerate dehydrogenase-like enzyme
MREPLNVLVFTRESSAPYRARLIDSGEVRYLFCESQDAIAARIEEADVILGSVSFPAQLLSRVSRLRWIQVTGAGVDGLLAQGRLPAHVLLTRAELSFGDQIAEYVIGHLLVGTQRLRDVHRLQAARRWEPLTVEFLKGRTMGVAGTGSIGRAVAQRARGVGMRTVGLSRTVRELAGFDACYGREQLPEFLSDLDVLVLCLPLTQETRGLIGSKELACMKRSAILVNVARGAIVDETALIDALRGKAIRAAILDVFTEEPLPETSPLWAIEGVTITSHHAGLNVPDEMIDYFLANLARFRSGDPLHGLVDPDRGY